MICQKRASVSRIIRIEKEMKFSIFIYYYYCVVDIYISEIITDIHTFKQNTFLIGKTIFCATVMKNVISGETLGRLQDVQNKIIELGTNAPSKSFVVG